MDPRSRFNEHRKVARVDRTFQAIRCQFIGNGGVEFNNTKFLAAHILICMEKGWLGLGSTKDVKSKN
jgi:hypothetical protein